jgi:predicted HicB family RNase H-like nuclease
MTYKGYEAVVEFDEAVGLFTGEVINTRDVITFQGKSVNELKGAFRNSVKEYLDLCRERNEEPEKPFSGNLLLRMPPELHRQITLEARRKSTSVNRYIIDVIASSGATLTR